jgi:fatty acid desaturase
MEAATAPAAPPPARHALPDPGEPVPKLAVPTLAIYFGALAVWGVATWAAVGDHAPAWATIPVAAAVSFVMFTMLHDATHYSISRRRWVNGLFGRLAMPFVASYASYPMIGYIHIEHHRNSNEDDTDPDTYASHGPWWQLPFRWLTVDLWYAVFYLRRRRSRPVRESAETGVCLMLTLAGIGVAAATGAFETLAVVYLSSAGLGVEYRVVRERVAGADDRLRAGRRGVDRRLHPTGAGGAQPGADT